MLLDHMITKSRDFCVVDHLGRPAVSDAAECGHHWDGLLPRPANKIARRSVANYRAEPVAGPDEMPDAIGSLREMRIAHQLVPTDLRREKTASSAKRREHVAVVAARELQPLAALVLIGEVAQEKDVVGALRKSGEGGAPQGSAHSGQNRAATRLVHRQPFSSATRSCRCDRLAARNGRVAAE
jgi:hypothetical protein